MNCNVQHSAEVLKLNSLAIINHDVKPIQIVADFWPSLTIIAPVIDNLITHIS